MNLATLLNARAGVSTAAFLRTVSKRNISSFKPYTTTRFFSTQNQNINPTHTHTTSTNTTATATATTTAATSTSSTTTGNNNVTNTPIPPTEDEKKTIWSYMRLRYFIAAGLLGALYWWIRRTRRAEHEAETNKHRLLPKQIQTYADIMLLTCDELRACVDASVVKQNEYNPLRPRQNAPKLTTKGIDVNVFQQKVLYLIERNRARRNKIRQALREEEERIEAEIRMEMMGEMVNEFELANAPPKSESTSSTEADQTTTAEETYTEIEAKTAKFADWYDDEDSDKAQFREFDSNILLFGCRTLASNIVNYYDAIAAVTLVGFDNYDPTHPRHLFYMSPEKLNAPESELTPEELEFKKLRKRFVEGRQKPFYETRKALDSNPTEKLRVIWKICTKPVQDLPSNASNEAKLDELYHRTLDYKRFESLMEVLTRTGHFDDTVMLKQEHIWPITFTVESPANTANVYYKQLAKSHDEPISYEEFEFASYVLALKRHHSFWYLDPSKISSFSDIKLWRMRKLYQAKELCNEYLGCDFDVGKVERVTAQTLVGKKPWSRVK